MPKRLKYTGPGVANVYDPEASVYDSPVAVESGHHVPDSVPQRVWKGLVEGDPERWTVVEYSPPGSKSVDKADQGSTSKETT